MRPLDTSDTGENTQVLNAPPPSEEKGGLEEEVPALSDQDSLTSTTRPGRLGRTPKDASREVHSPRWADAKSGPKGTCTPTTTHSVVTWHDSCLCTYVHIFTYIICKTVASVSFAHAKNVPEIRS